MRGDDQMEKYYKDRNFLTALLFLAFDAFYLFFGIQIPISDSSSCGAGFMPRVYGWCMLAVALILLVTTVLKIRRETAEESREKAEGMEIQKKDLIRVGVAFAGILMFVIFLKELGFILCSIPLLFILVLLLSPAHVKEDYIAKHCCDPDGNKKEECFGTKGNPRIGCMVPYYGKILAFAVLFTLFVYLLFGQALGLKMPAGILKNVLPF